MSGAVTPAHPLRRRVELTCSITDCDVNLDHLRKVVSARFFHCKITISPLVINQCLTGDVTLR